MVKVKYAFLNGVAIEESINVEDVNESAIRAALSLRDLIK